MKGPSRLQTVVVAPQEKVAVVITLCCRSDCYLLLAARLLLQPRAAHSTPAEHGVWLRLQTPFLSIKILVRIYFSAKSLHSKRLSPPDDHAMHVHGSWTGGANLHGKFGLLGVFLLFLWHYIYGYVSIIALWTLGALVRAQPLNAAKMGPHTSHILAHFHQEWCSDRTLDGHLQGYRQHTQDQSHTIPAIS